MNGAIIFAAYYLKALGWSIATNDAALISEIAGPDCSTCRRFVQGFRDIRAKGEVQRGGEPTLNSAQEVNGKFRIKAERVIRLVYAQTVATLYNANGSVRNRQPADSAVISLVFLSWASDGWKIVEVGAP